MSWAVSLAPETRGSRAELTGVGPSLSVEGCSVGERDVAPAAAAVELASATARPLAALLLRPPPEPVAPALPPPLPSLAICWAYGKGIVSQWNLLWDEQPVVD